MLFKIFFVNGLQKYEDVSILFEPGSCPPARKICRGNEDFELTGYCKEL